MRSDRRRELSDGRRGVGVAANDQRRHAAGGECGQPLIHRELVEQDTAEFEFTVYLQISLQAPNPEIVSAPISHALPMVTNGSTQDSTANRNLSST